MIRVAATLDLIALFRRLCRLGLLLSVLATGGMMNETLAQEAKPRVLMKTSAGDIEIELYSKQASITVENFLRYVDDGFYEGLIFHRVIPDFVIQGGGLTADLQRKQTLSPIINEANNGLLNSRGTLSMARTSDPNSATSQFFINLKNNAFLDYQPNNSAGYAVFARVVKGMDVVDSIAAKETTTQSGFRDVPVEPVVISSVDRIQP